MKLEGKVAFIPGGTAGIGEQIALAYAREGATVIVASRNQERVSRMEEELKKIGRGCGLIVDITNPGQVEAAVDGIVKRFGKLDIMLNSVGVYPATPVTEISNDEWLNVVKVNLCGPFYCAQAAAKVMIQQKSGRIIFITSGQALRGVPLMAHYSAAKGGIVALARAMAAELGIYGITVNTIAAGLTETDTVNNSMPPQFLEAVAQNVPLKRLAAPDEYNGTAVLLASDEGSYITGVTIAVDGGTSQSDAVH